MLGFRGMGVCVIALCDALLGGGFFFFFMRREGHGGALNFLGEWGGAGRSRERFSFYSGGRGELGLDE